MIAINELIHHLSTKDQLSFVKHLKQRNKRKDVRNISLFYSMMDHSEDRIKNEIGSNAYNVLKKRLSDQLIEFMAEKTISRELTDEMQVIKHIIVARKLILENSIELAFKLFSRAEKKALALDHYSLLNEIYHSMIEHSHHLPSLDAQELFQKLEANNSTFIEQERLITLYSSMQTLFTSKSFQTLPPSFHQSYIEHCKRFGVDESLPFTFKSIHQLCILGDLYGSQTRSYHQVDLFFEEHIKNLQGSTRDTAKMLPYQLEVLYAISNIYFRKKNVKKSMYYLDQLQQQMQRQEGRYIKKWNARYINLLILNLNFSLQPGRAMELSSKAIKNTEINEREYALLCLTHAMIFFQQGQLEEVKTSMLSLHRKDEWYLRHMGNEWLFNLKAMEILMHFDLGNDQLVESRIRSFQRKYAVHFRDEKDNPIWPFIQLIKLIVQDPSFIYTTEFSAKVEKDIPWRGDKEDLFNMCFYAWLKAKMIKENLYSTTIKILGFDAV